MNFWAKTAKWTLIRVILSMLLLGYGTVTAEMKRKERLWFAIFVNAYFPIQLL